MCALERHLSKEVLQVQQYVTLAPGAKAKFSKHHDETAQGIELALKVLP